MKKSDLAAKHFDNNLSCAQAILLAFGEELGLDEKTAIKITEGFGGGMAAMGKTCGAVSAAYMVLGLKYGREVNDDLEAKALTNQKVVEFTKRFKEKFRFDLCFDLLGGFEIFSDEQKAKAKEAGAFNNCSDYVASAATILEEMMAEDK